MRVENILTVEMAHLDKYVAFVFILIQVVFSSALLLVRNESTCLLKYFCLCYTSFESPASVTLAVVITITDIICPKSSLMWLQGLLFCFQMEWDDGEDGK